MSDVKSICYYHAPCLDGFTAAWIIHHLDPSVELIPVDYSDTEMALPTDSLVYVVDFTFPDVEFMKMLIDNNQSVIHIDHHVSAVDVVEELKAYGTEGEYVSVFDLERSGAGITWDTFHPDTERPHLVNFVEDRDLWRFSYHETKAFTEGLMTQSYTTAAWDWAQRKENAQWLVDQGNDAIRKRTERCIKQIISTGKDGTLVHDGMEWPAHTSVLAEPTDASDQTHLVIASGEYPIALAVWELEDGRFKVRVTTSEEGPQAHEIARAFEPNGGGHPRAAGFISDTSPLEGMSGGTDG